MTGLLIGISLRVATIVRWFAQYTIFVGQVLIKTAYGWWQWSERFLNNAGNTVQRRPS